MRDIFLCNLELARTQSQLRGRTLQVGLDTTPILGRGAVKDTFSLLADGIRQLLRTLARVQDTELALGRGAGLDKGTYMFFACKTDSI